MNTFMNKYTSKIYNTFMTRKPIETFKKIDRGGIKICI